MQFNERDAGCTHLVPAAAANVYVFHRYLYHLSDAADGRTPCKAVSKGMDIPFDGYRAPAVPVRLPDAIA